MLHRLILDSPAFKRVIRLQNSYYSIGRHPSNTIVIPSPQISRKHATLVKKINPNLEVTFQIIDGDLEGNRSRNGIWINGESFLERELESGDVIGFAEDIQGFYQILPASLEEGQALAAAEREGFFELADPLPQEQWEATLIHDPNFKSLPAERLEKLASMIEYSPYPLVEIDYFGQITYINLSAREKFPTLIEESLDHPLLKGINSNLQEEKNYYIRRREVQVEDKFYEQHLHYLPESQFIRSYVFDITERKVAEQSLNYQAFHDPITDLPNRFFFKQEVSWALTLAQERNHQIALLFVGFRDFDSLNDVLGHALVDETLCQVTERLKAQVRLGDCLCRWHGNEFAILLATCQGGKEAEAFAKRLLAVIKRPILIRENPLYLQAHIGVALYPDHGDNAEILLMNGNAALNDLKNQAYRPYGFYDPAQIANKFTRISLEHELHRALETDQFALYYQPQINVRTGQISGVEALLRWRHPREGLVSPAKFVPILEDSNLIVPVGEWVIRKACEHFRAWKTLIQTEFRIAINLSARQFQEADLLPTLARALAEENIPPQRIELEITESIVMQNVTAARQLLEAFRDLGLSLSMDDFGTGYSSLAYLKHFPFNTLKIDRAFIQDLLTDPADEAIIAAVLVLGRGFNLKVVAEGVETEAQARRLRSLGCEEMQGFWFSRPIPFEEMTEFLQSAPGRFVLQEPENPS
ncbi:MAG: EAL domain-containing protein [Cyanobacteriota bacterium]|jgi:diguanylate cyclase (GGDEF)-like protein